MLDELDLSLVDKPVICKDDFGRVKFITSRHYWVESFKTGNLLPFGKDEVKPCSFNCNECEVRFLCLTS